MASAASTSLLSMTGKAMEEAADSLDLDGDNTATLLAYRGTVAVTALALAPSGRFLAVGLQDGRTHVCIVREGCAATMHVLALDAPITALALAPTLPLLAAATQSYAGVWNYAYSTVCEGDRIMADPRGLGQIRLETSLNVDTQTLHVHVADARNIGHPSAPPNVYCTVSVSTVGLENAIPPATTPTIHKSNDPVWAFNHSFALPPQPAAAYLCVCVYSHDTLAVALQDPLLGTCIVPVDQRDSLLPASRWYVLHDIRPTELKARPLAETYSAMAGAVQDCWGCTLQDVTQLVFSADHKYLVCLGAAADTTSQQQRQRLEVWLVDPIATSPRMRKEKDALGIGLDLVEKGVSQTLRLGKNAVKGNVARHQTGKGYKLRNDQRQGISLLGGDPRALAPLWTTDISEGRGGRVAVDLQDSMRVVTTRLIDVSPEELPVPLAVPTDIQPMRRTDSTVSQPIGSDGEADQPIEIVAHSTQQPIDGGQQTATWLYVQSYSHSPSVFWANHVVGPTEALTEEGNGPTLAREKALFRLVGRAGHDRLLWRIALVAGGGIFHIRNALGQVPYLLAVKLGDRATADVTSDRNTLQHVEDAMGRSAIYYCMHSPESAPILLARLRRRPWYHVRDAYGLSPLHYAVLRGHSDVIRHIFLTAIAALPHKDQRAVLEAPDPNGKSALTLLVARQPTLVVDVLDRYGMETSTEEVMLGSGEWGLRTRTVYNVWLVDTRANTHTLGDEIVKRRDRDLACHRLVQHVYGAKWERYFKVYAVQFALQVCIIGFIWINVVGQSTQRHGTFTAFLGVLATVCCIIDLIWKIYEPVMTIVHSLESPSLSVILAQAKWRTVSYVVYYLVFLMWQFETPVTSGGNKTSFAIVALLISINFITYFTVFPQIGPVVISVLEMPRIIFYWGAFFALVFFSYSFTMVAVIHDETDQYFRNTGRSAESLWVSTFGMGGVWDELDGMDGDRGLAGKIVFYMYLISVPLIMINLLIGMMGDVYAEVYSDKERRWQLERSLRLHQLEHSLPMSLRRWFALPSVMATTDQVDYMTSTQ